MRYAMAVVLLLVTLAGPCWSGNAGAGGSMQVTRIPDFPFAQTALVARGEEAEPSPLSRLSWEVLPIESSETYTKGLWTSTVEREGVIHAAYWVCRNGSPVQSVVHYAFSADSGGSWTIEGVDTSSNYTSGECEMAWFRGGLDLDTLGRPHIGYTVSAPGVGSFCIHAWRNGPGDWRRDTVEMSSSSNLICYDADLKIDARDRVHIVYPYNGFQARYAVQSGDTWLVRDVDSDTTVGVGLALDSSDNPHIVVGTLGGARYAFSSDGGVSWRREVVGAGWWHCDIALDDDDEPLIARTSGSMSAGNVWLSRRTGPGTWTSMQVDDSSNNPHRPAVYYDRAAGTIHVAYYGGSQVKHSWSEDNGLTWSKENVAPAYMNSTANVPDFVRCDFGRLLPFESPGSAVSIARNLSVSSVDDARPAIRSPRFALRIAPNPFAQSLSPSVSYSLPAPDNVSLRLYDVIGKLVSTLASGYQPAGNYAYRLPPTAYRLSAGVYLLKFETDSYRTTEKLVIE